MSTESKSEENKPALDKQVEQWKQEAERNKAIADQANALLQQRQAEQKKNEEQEKAVLIVKISDDSKGFLNRNILMNFNIRNLRLLDNIMQAYKKLHLDQKIAEIKSENDRGLISKNLTVGEWDSERKEWKT